MIQIYEASNTNFGRNGDVVLFPTSCTVKAVLNGSWYLEMSHPLDDEGRWRFIGEEAVLKVPTWQSDDQLYRIVTVQKTDTEVTVTAYPIFYDAAGEVFLMDVRPTGCNGQAALNRMLEGFTGKYSASSDITTEATAYFEKRNFLDCLNGQADPTFISRWGGEILFDNYRLTVDSRVGSDEGVQVLYGKNIQGIQYTVDMNEVVTRIVPQAFNGRMLSSVTKWVDSPMIGSYAKVYTKSLSFDDIRLSADLGEGEDTEGLTVCRTQAELDAALQARCEGEFASGIDRPKVSLDIDMVPLQDMEEYRDVQMLETISLGDTVHCRHSRLGITSDARVVEIEWDCMTDRLKRVLLGDFTYNYFTSLQNAVRRVTSVIRSDGTIPADKVTGSLDASATSLYAQYDAAKRMDVLAILFENLDSSSQGYGALGIGTAGLMISKQRTSDGKGWVWTKAVTVNGTDGSTVTVGTLADRAGKNAWNMATGDMLISPETKVGTSAASVSLGDFVDGRQHVYTSEEIFSLLTQNGDLECLYMDEDGQMYVRFDYAKGGTLRLGGLSNHYGRLAVLDASGNEIGSIDHMGADLKGAFRTEADSDSGKKWLSMEGGVLSSGVGQNLHSLIDPEAECQDGITLVLQNAFGGIKIRAADVFFETTQAGGTRAVLHGDVEFQNDVFFSGNVNLLSLPYVTGPDLVVTKDGRIGMTGSSDAFVDSVRTALTGTYVSAAYNIQPVLGSYKDGHLPEGDELEGTIIPMLIAEDVERYLPVAVIHGAVTDPGEESGSGEGSGEGGSGSGWENSSSEGGSGAGQEELGPPAIDWNPRVLIPVMFQMIKSQKADLDSMRAELDAMQE